MKKNYAFQLLFLFLLMSFSLSGISQTTIVVHADKPGAKIDKSIYGHFAEHLGHCIYGGIYVGENSEIPNTKGFRSDVVAALKDLRVPLVRWPGGCFADTYHWRDGIGPKSERPSIINVHWGGVTENNSFGTHEFLDFCELIGADAYVNLNVGSGTVREAAEWVEYVTSSNESPMTNLRKKNGREKPWNVKYWAVGNETWGCGGNMTPDYYSDLFRRYSTYCREYDGNKLFKIASGASDYDYNWTETLMKNVGDRMQGVSLHYYTCKGWSGSKGSATKFDKADYLWTMGKCLEIEPVVKKHIAIMDKYDPQQKVGLMVDEWGTWWDQEPGINTALYQQNTMRDAFVAALSLNIFNKYTDRVKMTNIAQVVNVLQAMILTDGPKMLLTPTYHVFEMYKVHMGATYLPLDIQCDSLASNDKKFAAVSASASKDTKGLIHITLANIDPDKDQKIEIDLASIKIAKVSGTILTAKTLDAHNTFENPATVQPAAFKGAKVTKGGLTVTIPAKAILSIEISTGK